MQHKVTSVYAKTLLDACNADNQESVLKDALFLLDTLKSNPALQTLCENPVLSKDKKMDFFKTVLLSKLHPLTQKFMHLLHLKNRFAYLASICKEFIALEEGRRNILRATIISAKSLSTEQLGKISGKLEAEQPGKKFVLENIVDASLIAGFRIVEGDRITDSSVKSQLNTLRRKLAA
jgi:F-type H+-transporting ATPase subunit delta